MKITEFKIRNYRTLESVDLDFPSSYAAICGPNDCGKTNVVRAIRALMKQDPPFSTFEFEEEQEVSVKDDYPKWKNANPSEREIQLEITLLIQRERDAGLFQFVTKQLSPNHRRSFPDQPDSKGHLPGGQGGGCTSKFRGH